MIINKYAFIEKKECSCFCWCSFEKNPFLKASIFQSAPHSLLDGIKTIHMNNRLNQVNKNLWVETMFFFFKLQQKWEIYTKIMFLLQWIFKNRIFSRFNVRKTSWIYVELCREKLVGWSHQFFVKIEIPILKKNWKPLQLQLASSVLWNGGDGWKERKKNRDGNIELAGQVQNTVLITCSTPRTPYIAAAIFIFCLSLVEF